MPRIGFTGIALSEVFGLLHLTRSNFGLNGVVRREDVTLERLCLLDPDRRELIRVRSQRLADTKKAIK